MMADMTAAGDGVVAGRVVIDGDRDVALAALHRQHYPALVRLACLLLDDRASGEEVVQDAFIRVHHAWARVERPLPYLRATVVNLSRSRMRRRLLARRHVAPTERPAASAEEEHVRLMDHQEVLDALHALPRRQRECLVLRYYLELSEAEIAEALGISAGSVKSHSHRGIAALGRRLEERS
jgi:RNA polymerase sigma-70 factor (sigma-E family)